MTVALDHELTDRVDALRRDVRSFLEQSAAAMKDPQVRQYDRQIDNLAKSEAKRALESGYGSITLTRSEMTPGMEQIAVELRKSYENWQTRSRNYASDLDATIARLEQQIARIEEEDAPELDEDKRRQLARIKEEFEGSIAYRQNREHYRAEKGRFERLRQYNRGNFPSKSSRFYYWPILILFAASDAWVNYFTFLPRFEVAIAFIATAGVVLCIAAASHFHGKFLKQHSFLSLDDSGAERKQLRMWSRITTATLIVALLFLLWARYTYFSSIAGSGGASFLTPAFIIRNVAPILVVNLMIYFAGVLVSYASHERVPGLKEAYANWLKADAELDDMQRAFNERTHETERKYESDEKALRAEVLGYEHMINTLTELRNALEAQGESFRSQLTTRLAEVMRRYATALCEAISRLEGDMSAIAFNSPTRGKMSVIDFEATDFGGALAGRGP